MATRTCIAVKKPMFLNDDGNRKRDMCDFDTAQGCADKRRKRTQVQGVTLFIKNMPACYSFEL
jgi:hypothetical protein